MPGSSGGSRGTRPTLRLISDGLHFDVFPHAEAAEVGVVVAAAAAAFGHFFQLLGVAAADDDVLGLEGQFLNAMAASATRFLPALEIRFHRDAVDALLDRFFAVKQDDGRG